MVLYPNKLPESERVCSGICNLSANIQELQKQANSMIPGISRDTLLNALVPLPPLIEQARIVSKIEQLASIMSR